MPQHFNSVTLIGNLTRDPDLRTTDGGSSVADFGLAINRKYKANGEWQENAAFIEVTCWGSTAENAKKFLSKGDPVFIDGRISQDTWESDGQKQSKVYVTAETVNFLHSGDGDGEASPDDVLDDVDVDDDDGEIPF
jgi:single-strand DNA-binding protein